MSGFADLSAPGGVALWLVAGAAACAAAVASVRLRWLTPGGSIGALAVGLTVWVGTGVGGGVLLLTFFVTSSALTTVRRRWPEEERRVGNSASRDIRPFAEGRGRSAIQVLANGGVAALAAAAGLADWLPDATFAVTGSLAAATADTWATEVGTKVGGRTLLVTSWRTVPPGRSGGVSWPGSAAAGAGAALIGAAAALLFGAGGWAWLTVGVAGGVAGTLADSFVGAGIEGRASWVNNDIVNGVCTLVGGGVGWIVGRALVG